MASDATLATPLLSDAPDIEQGPASAPGSAGADAPPPAPPPSDTVSLPSSVNLSSITGEIQKGDASVLDDIQNAIRNAEAEVNRRLEAVVPKVTFPESEADVGAALDDVKATWSKVMRDNVEPIIGITISMITLVIAWATDMAALASPYITMGVNFVAFAMAYRTTALSYQKKMMKLIDELEDRTHKIAVECPKEMKQKVDELIQAVQGALAGQAPLYAKVKEVAKWIKTASFNLGIEYSAEWAKSLQTELNSKVESMGIPLNKIKQGVKVFGKDGTDVTSQVFSPQAQELPESAFPLSIQFTKIILPDPAELMGPLSDVAEQSGSKISSAAEGLISKFNDMVPEVLKDKKQFTKFFIVAPLAVILLVNVAVVLMSSGAAETADAAADETAKTAAELQRSSTQLIVAVTQLIIAVVAALEYTQRRLHDAVQKAIELKMSKTLQEEMHELMDALHNNLDRAVKAFWPALKKVLALLRIILKLKAAMVSLRSVADSLPDRGRKILQDVREEGGKAASDALRQYDKITQKFQGLGQSTMTELQGIGSKSLAAAVEQKQVLADVAEQAKNDLKEAAARMVEQAEAEPQVLLDAATSAAKDAVKEVLEAAKALPPALKDDLETAVTKARDDIASFAEDAAKAAEEVAAAAEDSASAGGQAAVESLAETAADKANDLRESLDKTEDGLKALLTGLGTQARDQAKGLRAAVESAAIGLRQKLNAAKGQLLSAIETAADQAKDTAEATGAAVANALAACARDVVDAMRGAAKQALDSAEAEFESLLGQAQTLSTTVQQGLDNTVAKGRTDVEQMLAQVAKQVDSVSSILDADIEDVDTTPLKAAAEAAQRATAAATATCGDALKAAETELKSHTGEAFSTLNSGLDAVRDGLRSRIDVVKGKLDQLDAVGAVASGVEEEVKALTATVEEPLAKVKEAAEQLGAALSSDPLQSFRSECDPCSAALDAMTGTVKEAKERIQDKCDEADAKIKQLSRKAARVLGTSRAITVSKKAVKQLEQDSQTAADKTAQEADKQVEDLGSQRGGIIGKSNEVVSTAEAALGNIAQQGISEAEKQTAILAQAVKETVEDVLQQLSASCIAKAQASPEVAQKIVLQAREDVKRVRLRAKDAVPQLTAQMSDAAKNANTQMLALAQDAANSVQELQGKAGAAATGDHGAILRLADEADKQADGLDAPVKKAQEVAQKAVADVGSAGKKQADELGIQLKGASSGLQHKLEVARSELSDMVGQTEAEAKAALTAAQQKIAAVVKAASGKVVQKMKSAAQDEVDSVLEALGGVADEVKALVNAARESIKDVVQEGREQLARIATRAARKKEEIADILAEVFGDDGGASQPGKGPDDPEVIEALAAFDAVVAKATDLSDTIAKKIETAEAAFASILDVSTKIDELKSKLQEGLSTALAGAAQLTKVNPVVTESRKKLGNAMSKITEATDAVGAAVEAFPTDMGKELQAALARIQKYITDLSSLVSQSDAMMAPVNEGKGRVKGAIDDLHDAASGARAAVEALEAANKLVGLVQAGKGGNLAGAIGGAFGGGGGGGWGW